MTSGSSPTDPLLLVSAVSRARLRAICFGISSVFIAGAGMVSEEGRSNWLPGFVLVFAVAGAGMVPVGRFFIRTHLEKAVHANLAQYRKGAVLGDEYLLVVIQVAIGLLVCLVLANAKPALSGALCGVPTAVALMFGIQAIVLRKAEQLRGVIFWEPSSKGKVDPGSYLTPVGRNRAT